MAGLGDITLGNFTKVYVGEDADLVGAMSELEEVQSVGDISDEATIVDVQKYGQKYLRKLVGSANAAAIEVVCNYVSDSTTGGIVQKELLAAYTASTPKQVVISMLEDATETNGVYVLFNCLVASASITNAFDETRTITFSLVPTNGFPTGYQDLPYAV
jgi:hypothetical protein